MYLDRLLPNVVQYVGKKQPFDTLVMEPLNLWRVERGGSSAEFKQSTILHPRRYLEKHETFTFDLNTDRASIFGECCLDTSERYGNVSEVIKNNLKLDDRVKNIVIGALDPATYMYLDKIIPDDMQYVGRDHNVDLLIENVMDNLNICEEEESEVTENGETD
ncbi:hypothetical protein TNCV_81941 [Trichonephila clavipes]|nr:hypothetical protein TNCV_81941 [Trichonephila clavipes]